MVPMEDTLQLPREIGIEPTVQLALNDLIRPGDVVCDIGAHVGHLTQTMSYLTGPKGMVFSFEPAAKPMKKLLKRVAMGHLQNVYPYQVALGEKTDISRLFHVGRFADENALDPLFHEKPITSEVVRSICLDDFFNALNMDQSLDLVKLDVDGAEYSVLVGMEKIIDIYISGHQS